MIALGFVNWRGIAVGTAMLTSPAAAQTWTGHVTLPTFLHDGAGQAYAVIDELDIATPLSVLDCADGWCQIAAEGRAGYVPAALLAPFAATRADAERKPGESCFDAQLGGYGAGEAYKYCGR